MADVEKLTLKKLRAELARREAEHRMTSADFYDRWLSGLAGDIPNAAEWFELYEAAVLQGFPAPPEYVAAFRAVREGPTTKTVVLTPEMILEGLAAFEAEHGESSAAFYKRFMEGKAGDSHEAMEWATLYEWAVEEGMLPPPQLDDSYAPRPEVSIMEVVRLTPERLKEKLARCEAEHGMSSAEFYERFLAGTGGDSPEAVFWSFLCRVGVKQGLLKPPTHVRV